MNARFMNLLVKRFVITDDDEGVHEPDFPQNFESVERMLETLREKNPGTNYMLYALVDA